MASPTENIRQPETETHPDGSSGPAVLKNGSWVRHPVAQAGLLLLLVMAAYLPALSAGFVWDDDAYVTQNPLLTDSNGLREIWFSGHTQSQYFPLVYTTFRIEHALWGLNPFGFHLVNVMLHGLNAVLVWIVLRRLHVPAAWLAAAIFALHPVQVESVAWVTELKNVESLLFYLLAVLAWIKFLGLTGARCRYYYALALGAYLLALFAKTTACTLPAALVLVMWLRGQRLTRSRALAIVPFVFIGVGMGALSIWWEGHLDNFNRDFDVSLNPLQRMLLAGRALWFYAAKLAWPADLAFSYPRWDINFTDPLLYVPLAGCIVVAILLWTWRGKIGRSPLAGIAFFVAALSPLLGFFMEYTFRYSYVADHYQYNASIGLISVGAGVAWKRLAKADFWLPIQAAVLLVLGGLTFNQCIAYRNLETLWRDTVAKNPGSWMAHHNLGIELFQQSRIDEALEQYQEAVALHPNGDVEQGDLGAALLEKGRNTEAITHLQAALAINSKLFGAQNNLALAYVNIGRFDQAIVHFRTALQINSNAPGTLMNLGNLFQHQGNLAEAIPCYRQVTVLYPAEVTPWRRLAAALSADGRADEAVAAYRQGLQLTTNNENLLLDLGNTFLLQSNYDGAANCFSDALKADASSAGLHYNLAIARGLQGQVTAERSELQKALILKPDFSLAQQRLMSLRRQPVE